jgi:preprotein translocase subunit YajC
LLVFLVFCVVCFVFVSGGSVLLIILVFCVVCFVYKQHRPPTNKNKTHNTEN